MSDETRMYAVCEVGGFGEIPQVEDPTITEVGKKKKTMEELMKETIAENKKNCSR